MSSPLRRAIARAIVLAAIVLAAPFAAGVSLAQGTTLVPPGDLAYSDIDRLLDLGVLDSVIVGQRPYSRHEFGRLVRVARATFDRGAATGGRVLPNEEWEQHAGIVLQRLETRFGDDADGRANGYPLFSLFDGASLNFTSTNAARRGFPAPHTRPIEALIDPLALPRLAQPEVPGRSTFLELSQRIEPASWLSFYARERIEYRTPLDTTITRSRGELLVAAAYARFGNAALSVGRQPFAWAQSDGDGLFFSSDAPAIDQISLQTDAPVQLRGPFGALGAIKATLVLADLGPTSVRSHSKLLAYKVSTRPKQWLELGGTFMNHFGGEGGRRSSRGNLIVDFLPFIDIFRRHNYTDTTQTFDVDSDKMLGLDARVRIAPLGGMTIAGEMLIDDFDVHILPRLLTGYGSSTVHLIFPSLGTPAVALRLGARHMGTITYSHNVLTNGFATRARLLGNALGPDAKEFSGELRWAPAAAGALVFEAREQIYSNATYGGGYTDSTQVQTTYYKVSRTDDERRHIAIATLLVRPDADISLSFRAGLQYSDNYAFTGSKRRDYVFNASIRLRQ